MEETISSRNTDRLFTYPTTWAKRGGAYQQRWVQNSDSSPFARIPKGWQNLPLMQGTNQRPFVTRLRLARRSYQAMPK